MENTKTYGGVYFVWLCEIGGTGHHGNFVYKCIDGLFCSTIWSLDRIFEKKNSLRTGCCAKNLVQGPFLSKKRSLDRFV